MNLIEDPWVPVLRDGRLVHVELAEILCRDEPWSLSLTRDDMEFAALQLLVCLTQAIYTPDDEKELKELGSKPLDEKTFEERASPYLDWFSLDHEKTPFMQVRGVKASKPTPIQKLFVGLPEGNNHALFNRAGEVDAACSSCTAIALFNQAVNCPSFGGGFKEGLRGGSPITTLIRGEGLRETIWKNVLDRQGAREVGLKVEEKAKPNWVEVIQPGQKIAASGIDLITGLFWQSAHVELLSPDDCDRVCPICGRECSLEYAGFNKEKFSKFEIVGHWPHPHSPRRWEKGKDNERTLSFNRSAPTWTQLNELILHKEEEKRGQIPAAVVTRFREIHPGEPCHLAVGGYSNKQAAVIDRRHETISLAEGWDSNLDGIGMLVEVGVEIKNALRSKVYGFGKETGVEGLSKVAERRYYERTEHLIHRVLRNMDFSQLKKTREELTRDLGEISRKVFAEVVKPYIHSPKGAKTLAISTRTLNAALAKIKKGA
ncbi:MAG: type I-E CRISPR-associated protein Cse1/CasA [Polyangia bacterium]